MLIPIGDDNSKRITFPLITYVLIGLNVYVFWLELKYGDAFVYQYSVVPAYLFSGRQSIFNLVSSMFVHGGYAHIFGNMLYLFVFGDNVEDNLGRTKYFIFYFVCGIAAMLTQCLVRQDSLLPNLGASGAIAGILAAYIILFPHNRVRVLILFPFSVRMSAWFVLGFWILTQLFSGYTDIFHHAANAEGGIAYMAHIGGFFTGVLLTFVFRKREAKAGITKRLGIKDEM